MEAHAIGLPLLYDMKNDVCGDYQMKRLLLLWLSVSLVFVLFSSNTFAQDYTRWNLPEGAKARLGKGLLSGSIAYSPDGTRLAVSANIGIWLYDAHSGAEIDLFTGQALSVNSVAFSPDGYILAGGSGDGTIRLWSVETGAHIQTLTGHTRGIKKIAFNPDGNTIVSGSADKSTAFGMRRQALLEPI
jgi:WD40 repeat protein